VKTYILGTEEGNEEQQRGEERRVSLSETDLGYSKIKKKHW